MDHPNHYPAEAMTTLQQTMVSALAVRAHKALDQVYSDRLRVSRAAAVDAALEAWRDFATGDPMPHEVLADVFLRVVALLDEQTAVNLAAEQFGEWDADIRLDRGMRVQWCADHEQLSVTYRLEPGGLVTLPLGGRYLPDHLERLGA